MVSMPTNDPHDYAPEDVDRVLTADGRLVKGGAVTVEFEDDVPEAAVAAVRETLRNATGTEDEVIRQAFLAGLRALA